ncbi:hypothetical protein LOK49_LG03G03476 [Camellia lanceoleosa]|uniref:Uncharacterized protein n=1 Tax=Camellia lanceoleosa TaxID=1840588 RepID=A0ACC0I9U9_9ERIC|nr:hypothetical protein LOK49_LG03G03476 [Camellia lanceoleosa]
MLVLMETKVGLSSMGMFFNNMGFTASSNVEPTGRAGGIWVLWDLNQVGFRVYEATFQAIHVTMQKEDFEEWVLSAIYASPNARQRDELWSSLENMEGNMQSPWLAVGNFNDYTSLKEIRSFFQNQNVSRINKLWIGLINATSWILAVKNQNSLGPTIGKDWRMQRKGLIEHFATLNRGLPP